MNESRDTEFEKGLLSLLQRAMDIIEDLLAAQNAESAVAAETKRLKVSTSALADAVAHQPKAN